MESHFDRITVNELVLDGDRSADAVTLTGAASLVAAAGGGGGGAEPNRLFVAGTASGPGEARLAVLPLAELSSSDPALTLDGSGKLLIGDDGLYSFQVITSVSLDTLSTVPCGVDQTLESNRAFPAYYKQGGSVIVMDPSVGLSVIISSTYLVFAEAGDTFWPGVASANLLLTGADISNVTGLVTATRIL